jgi:hypothetical protein
MMIYIEYVVHIVVVFAPVLFVNSSIFFLECNEWKYVVMLF